jgi:transposase
MTRARYPSDPTDRQWARPAPHLPPPKPGGPPRSTDVREVVNAILHVLRNGIVGRVLPHDFSPWATVYDYCKPHLVAWARAVGGWMVEIVARPKEQTGVAVRPRRWVVERTFAWLGRCRRLGKDDEGLPETHEAWVHLSMIHLMLKRLTR